VIHLLTQFGAEQTSGLGALGVDGKAFLVQLITFGLAFLVLKKWAFKPILKVLQDRRETIEKGVALGEQMQKDKAVLEAKIVDSLHEARVQADKIIADAHNAGREAIQNAEEAARTKAEVVLAQAADRIKQDTGLARKRLEGELAGLISEATEAIIHEKIDVKKDAQLIDRALKGASS
jgi:F-type H+-transporting ATPase subunit b